MNIYLENDTATQIFAIDLACALKTGDFVALRGDLGAGKSTLARALIRTLGRDRYLDVPSPTFSLVQYYECGRFNVAHADLYRLSDCQEIEELGLGESLSEGILLVEWPEQVGDLLPPANFMLALDYAGEGRQLTLEMTEEAAKRFERSRQIRAFLEAAGYARAQRYYLAGDASSRCYETVIADGNGDNKKYVLMDGAKMHPPPAHASPDYARAVNLAQDIRPFIDMAHMLESRGFASPKIFAGDMEQRLLLLEYLGQDGIADETGTAMATRYLAAAELLADIHSEDWPDLSLKIPAYDQPTFYRETSLLLDWYLHYHLGIDVTEDTRQLYATIWQDLIDKLQEAEQGLCLRDYHSPNIIWRAEHEGNARLGLIDFQDALIGPVAYDLASLAQDARITISPELEASLIDAYCARRKMRTVTFDEVGLREIYPLAAAQRVSKILGLFVRLDRRDGKPEYLAHLPRLLDYLARNLRSSDLSALRDFCQRHKIIPPFPSEFPL